MNSLHQNKDQKRYLISYTIKCVMYELHLAPLISWYDVFVKS